MVPSFRPGHEAFMASSSPEQPYPSLRTVVDTMKICKVDNLYINFEQNGLEDSPSIVSSIVYCSRLLVALSGSSEASSPTRQPPKCNYSRAHLVDVEPTLCRGVKLSLVDIFQLPHKLPVRSISAKRGLNRPRCRVFLQRVMFKGRALSGTRTRGQGSPTHRSVMPSHP